MTEAPLPPAGPILKWAGGKQQLLPQLLERLPARFGTYYEPFFGGGALFFALAPERAVIGDANPELVTLYRAVAEDPEAVSAALAGMATDPETYYAVRAEDWTALPPTRAAARTLYLNRLCYNGLYRVNRQGGFNVPYGRYARPAMPRPEALKAAAAHLRRATIRQGDWRDTVADARAGDVVFLDPPYIPVGRYADFKRYTAEQFRDDDHRAMLPVIEDLRRRGVFVLLTNGNAPLLHELFGAYEITVVATRRNVNSKAAGRRGEDALVVVRPDAGSTTRTSCPGLGRSDAEGGTRASTGCRS